MKFKLRRYYLYYAGRFLAFLFYLIPVQVGLYIGSAAGAIAYCLVGRHRRVALENLRLAFRGEKSERDIRLIAMRVFQNLGRNLVEIVNFPKINSSNIDRIVRIENIEVIEKALAAGRGAIVFTAHFGNWELLASTFGLKGYSGAVVGRRIYFERYDAFLNNMRRLHGVNIIYRDASAKAMLRVLKGNAMLGILPDQDVDSVEGVFVDFFGTPAYTPTGPVLLARASGAPLIPSYIVREKGFRHRLVLGDPLELAQTGDAAKDLLSNVRLMSEAMERYIRMYPEQWVWVHRRWKTRPN